MLNWKRLLAILFMYHCYAQRLLSICALARDFTSENTNEKKDPSVLHATAVTSSGTFYKPIRLITLDEAPAEQNHKLGINTEKNRGNGTQQSRNTVGGLTSTGDDDSTVPSKLNMLQLSPKKKREKLSKGQKQASERRSLPDGRPAQFRRLGKSHDADESENTSKFGGLKTSQHLDRSKDATTGGLNTQPLRGESNMPVRSKKSGARKNDEDIKAAVDQQIDNRGAIRRTLGRNTFEAGNSAARGERQADKASLPSKEATHFKPTKSAGGFESSGKLANGHTEANDNSGVTQNGGNKKREPTSEDSGGEDDENDEKVEEDEEEAPQKQEGKEGSKGKRTSDGEQENGFEKEYDVDDETDAEDENYLEDNEEAEVGNDESDNEGETFGPPSNEGSSEEEGRGEDDTADRGLDEEDDGFDVGNGKIDDEFEKFGESDEDSEQEEKSRKLKPDIKKPDSGSIEGNEVLADGKKKKINVDIDMQDETVQRQAQRSSTYTNNKVVIFYRNATKTYPSLHYLGAGYDIVFGNPIGDPETMVDPGYRDPVVQLNWAQNKKGVTNDLRTLQPIEGWIRPEISCKQSEKVEEVATLSDYQDKLSVDASLSVNTGPFFSFSGSAGYKSFAKTSSKGNKKSFILRTYCSRYVAGLYPYVEWENTEGFQNAVKMLPRDFTGLTNTTKCPVEVYLDTPSTPECVNNIVPWMLFFKTFGTHVVHEVHLGGKLTHQVSIDKSAINKLKSEGVDVTAELKASYMGMGAEASVSVGKSSKSREHLDSKNTEKMTIVIGGRTPRNIHDPAMLSSWAASVAELPMPIKVALTPLSHVLKDANLKASYDKAVVYYGRAFGMSALQLQMLRGKIVSLPRMINDGEQITYAGAPPGTLVCPNGKVIQLGFALHMNLADKTDYLAKYHINDCKPGLESCHGSGTRQFPADDVRMWALCGKEPIAASQQVVNEGRGLVTAKCPEGMAIGLGFGITLSDGPDGAAKVSMYACRSGQKECSKSTPENEVKTYVWIACFDETVEGIKNIVSIASTASSGNIGGMYDRDGHHLLECPGRESPLIAGFMLEVHTALGEDRVRKKFHKCKSSGLCSISGLGLSYGENDHHTLTGWINCSTTPFEKEEKSVTRY